MKDNNNDMKGVMQDILKNVVNGKYGRTSNEFVDIMWNEFNKEYKS